MILHLIQVHDNSICFCELIVVEWLLFSQMLPVELYTSDSV